MHKAKEMLHREDTPNTLDVMYKNERRTLTYHPCNGSVTIKYPGCQKQSIIFKDWDNITKIFEPKLLSVEEKKAAEDRKARKLTLKFIEAAHYADFDNSYIRTCLKANMKKGAKANGLSTGCKIDGELITIDTIKKVAPDAVQKFWDAFDLAIQFETKSFKFQNYMCRMIVELDKSGKAHGVFIKELVRFSGYYKYYLINRSTFIGYSMEERK